jgi:hypothetical protein
MRVKSINSLSTTNGIASSEITIRENNYCEIFINRGVLIFADFVVHLNHENKIKRNTIFPLIVAYNV